MRRERDPRKLYPIEKKVLQAVARHVHGGKRRRVGGHVTINDIKKSLQMSAEGDAWKVERAVNNLSRMELVNKDDISRKVAITNKGLRLARRLSSPER